MYGVFVKKEEYLWRRTDNVSHRPFTFTESSSQVQKKSESSKLHSNLCEEDVTEDVIKREQVLYEEAMSRDVWEKLVQKRVMHRVAS